MEPGGATRDGIDKLRGGGIEEKEGGQGLFVVRRTDSKKSLDQRLREIEKRGEKRTA